MNKQDIAAISDTKTTKFFVEAWQKEVTLRSWSMGDRSKFISKFDPTNSQNNAALVVALSLADDQGNQLFSLEQADLDILNGKSGESLQAIADAALKLNGLFKDQQDDAKKN